MNYYYNPYSAGNNPYMPSPAPQPYQYNNPPAPVQIPQNPAPAGLNGKIVDSEDMVKATEVPIGGYGIFPKADLSEIYVKTWNNNGTTSLITFKPFIPPEPTPSINEISASNMETVLQKISNLENKLDTLLDTTNKIAPPHQVPIIKKEGLKANEY